MNKNTILKLLIFLVVAWLLFSVGKSLYQNWRVNKEVAGMKAQIDDLERMNQEMKDKILYYQSPSYREKIARERFGLQKPGENVVVIVPEEKPKEVDVQKAKEQNLPNYKKWWNYFFGLED